MKYTMVFTLLVLVIAILFFGTTLSKDTLSRETLSGEQSLRQTHLWNNPYPHEDPISNTLYTAFTERPEHLDPAKSNIVNEAILLNQIYEPPLQYHYLKRPYTLIPLTAEDLPTVRYLDANGQEIKEEDAEKNKDAGIMTEYEIKIKPGIMYQPHPAFAKNGLSEYVYLSLTPKEAKHYNVLSDFTQTGTRECIAEDYVFQIKRLADPDVSSPIYSVMSQYIVGLKALRETLSTDNTKSTDNANDRSLFLRQYNLPGAFAEDKYTYKIRLYGLYPQFRYWLAMVFFAPMPWEVTKFFSQPGFSEHNLSLDWYPVGTGPYMLTQNNPDRRMILSKNPNYRNEFYPTEGMPEDVSAELLVSSGARLPLIDRVIFTLEKEDIPYWNKFLQGYYDISGISSDNFSRSVTLSTRGQFTITEELKAKGLKLRTSVTPAIWFWGFNMLDETVGGYSDNHIKLRKAIRMVFDVDEFISIFINGRGIRAEGPLPPDIFGYEKEPKEHAGTIEAAKALMQEAGYANGLTLYLDSVTTGDPEEMEILAWTKRQFAKLNINLVVRGTDFNRFQEKTKAGTAQIFFRGWIADYPDPENFLFLFYGPNSAAKAGGENDTNYHNDTFDALYQKMRILPNNDVRLNIIGEMLTVLNNDNPVIWGFYPKSFVLNHGWVQNTKPGGIINNTLKYQKIDPVLRYEKRMAWNKPKLWPFIIIIAFLCIVFVPVFIQYSRKIHKPFTRCPIAHYPKDLKSDT